MGGHFGAGFHAAPGRQVDVAEYERYIGRWSRLFVPALLSAAEVAGGCRMLDVATGTGEAALIAASTVEPDGLVVGTDISPAMLKAAQVRPGARSLPLVATDGE